MDVWSVCTMLAGTITMEQIGSLHVVLLAVVMQVRLAG